MGFGLFGMIKAFNAIVAAGAMGQPELLAGGIGEALITTAAGLSVAIPALIAYMFFISRVDKLIVEIDALGQDVVQAIAADNGPRRRRRLTSRRASRSASSSAAA